MIYYNYASLRVCVNYINNSIELQLSLNLNVALFSIDLVDIDILKEVSVELDNKSDFHRRSVIEIYASLIEARSNI